MRTKNVFYNMIIVLCSNIILPILGLLKYSFFVGFYGSSVNGLQLTIIQIIMFMNICEISFSLAFRQLLYKPLATLNKKLILKYYNGAVRVFRIVGVLFLIVSVIGAIVFPLVGDSPYDYISTLFIFLLFCLPYGVSYFLMGPNLILIADQKEYRINIWIQGIAIVRMLLMIGIVLLKLDFIFIIIIEGLNILLSNIISRWIALRAYPWLLDQSVVGDCKEFVESAKFTLAQRLSILATSNTDNIIISLFMGYNMTSVFGSYSYLSDSLSKIVNGVITSAINSFGNLFNDSNARPYSVFKEFFNFASFIGSIISICVFIIMNDFLYHWLNDPSLYFVGDITSFLFGINLFYFIIKEPIIIVRDANGLFKYSRNNAILIAFTKIVFSLLLVGCYGFNGILLATFMAYWVVDFLYNPRLVYKSIFGVGSLNYYRMVFVRVVIMGVVGFIYYFVWNSYLSFIGVNIINFLLAGLLLGIGVSISLLVLYYLLFKEFRDIIVRIINLLFSFIK